MHQLIELRKEIKLRSPDSVLAYRNSYRQCSSHLNLVIWASSQLYFCIRKDLKQRTFASLFPFPQDSTTSLLNILGLLVVSENKIYHESCKRVLRQFQKSLESNFTFTERMLNNLSDWDTCRKTCHIRINKFNLWDDEHIITY